MAAELERDGDFDLHWRAFRYVAGEIEPEEAEAFERVLDEDQEAREAVAWAVELAGAIASLRPEATLVLTRPRRRSVAALIGAVTLAAAACLGWMVMTVRGPAPLPGQSRDAAASAPDARVALAWSTLHEERGLERDDSSALVAWNDDLPASSETDDASDLALPPWLIDAATLSIRAVEGGKPAKEL
jgi:hypothetical protein